jgi:hypothetical protein
VSFSASKPNHTFTDLPHVLFRRGVEFRADHLTATRQRLYGFFVDVHVRRLLSIGLEDSSVAEAATNDWVHVKADAGSFGGKLVSVEPAAKRAVIDAQGTQLTVPYSDVVIPASSRVLRALSQTTGRNLVGEASLRAQKLSYRLLENGQRNRSWLADRYEKVREWLVSASQFGRIDLAWPNSDIRLALKTRPIQVLPETTT